MELKPLESMVIINHKNSQIPLKINIYPHTKYLFILQFLFSNTTHMDFNEKKLQGISKGKLKHSLKKQNRHKTNMTKILELKENFK